MTTTTTTICIRQCAELKAKKTLIVKQHNDGLQARTARLLISTELITLQSIIINNDYKTHKRNATYKSTRR